MSAASEKQYVRLPGRSRPQFGLFARERGILWLGADHLLHLRSTGYSETCKRFYYQDIQAVTLCPTKAGRTASLVLWVIAGVLLLVLALPFWWSPYAAIPSFLLAILAVINNLLGPTCRCRLYTAVQADDLTSLRRLRSARKAITLLEQRIEAVQGPLDAEMLAMPPGDDEPILVRPKLAAGSVATTDAMAPKKHEDGKIHLWFFSLLALLGVIIPVDLLFQHPIKNLFDSAFFILTLILGIVAIGRQRNSDLPARLGTATWTGIGVLCAIFGASMLMSFINSFQYAMEHPGSQANPFLDPIPLEGIMLSAYCLVSSAALLLLSAIGLAQLRQIRVARAAGIAEEKPSDPISREDP